MEGLEGWPGVFRKCGDDLKVVTIGGGGGELEECC